MSAARLPAVCALSLCLLPNPALARGPAAVRVVGDVPYAQRADADPALTRLDLYAPEGAQGLPVVVFVHGGGWRIGDKRAAARLGGAFARQGFVVASVNYRLSPAVRHPAHVEDVIAAAAWLREHVAEHGGDPDRLVLMGHSAGAHLAALAATDRTRLAAAGLTPATFRGVVLLDGAGYDIPRQIEELGGARSRALYTSTFGEDPAVWRDASPLTHVRRGEGFAPFLLLHVAGRRDSRLQAEGLAEALRARGGRAEVVPADKTHRTIFRDLGRPDDALTERVLRFLQALPSR